MIAKTYQKTRLAAAIKPRKLLKNFVSVKSALPGFQQD